MNSKNFNTKYPDFTWQFSDENDGSFIVENASNHSPVYFPLMNSFGMKSYVTPDLKGDLCSSFHHWLTPATVTEDLHRNVSSRNFWIKECGKEPWSVTGVSVFQKTENRRGLFDAYSVEGHLGFFSCKRLRKESSIEAHITIMVPEVEHYVELLKLSVKNVGLEDRSLKAAYALPIFARSADHIRDHRQVTTMFQNTYIEKFGVRVKPKMVHDESGHRENKTNYSVMGIDQNGNPPSDIWALVEDYIGQGGSFDNPESIYDDSLSPKRTDKELHGKDTVGAFRFDEVILKPGDSVEYIIIQGITEDKEDLDVWIKQFGSVEKFDFYLDKTIQYWKNRTDTLDFYTGSNRFDNWVKWIPYQVKARQIFGNSYLPDYGYGRGGRGWRDLWQDLLSIFLIDPESARSELLNNFKGIRVDGSNATIIGNIPGEFKADRNNIPRTWCDHGAWPVFIMNFYINQTGDFAILFNEISYWKDRFIHRSQMQDTEWNEIQGNAQLDQAGRVYTGSVLEHLLVQQLSAFYNVGEHNILLLEGADWNDTYDMARDRGESVCFHNFYASNFKTIAEILKRLKSTGTIEIDIMNETMMLLDTLPGQAKVDYKQYKDKQVRLHSWFDKIKHKIEGKKTSVSIDQLITDLEIKFQHMVDQIVEFEQISTLTGFSYFNGHYDNLGNKVGGIHNGVIQMDLTSQVMPILCNIADEDHTKNAYKAVCEILKDPGVPGIRLCTEFKELDLNLGRVTGFVYGNKEHGSKWMQQNIMLAYGLYQQGFMNEGFEVLNDVYHLSCDTPNAKIFPGIPSFFNNENRGAYAYLTGSSSWYLLTLATRVFGVRGENGDLCIEPMLQAEQFDWEGMAMIRCNFQNLKLNIRFENKKKIDPQKYSIKSLLINRETIKLESGSLKKVLISANVLQQLKIDQTHTLEVILH
jgi:cellobiose phosphorylase